MDPVRPAELGLKSNGGGVSWGPSLTLHRDAQPTTCPQTYKILPWAVSCPQFLGAVRGVGPREALPLSCIGQGNFLPVQL